MSSANDNIKNSTGQNNTSSSESSIIELAQTQGTNPSMVQRTIHDNGQHIRSITESVERRLVFNDEKDD